MAQAIQMPNVDVICLALPPSVRQRLIENGFRTLQDLAGVSVEDLETETRISREEATSVLQALGDASAIRGQRTATEILAKEQMAAKILTFCGDLDLILGGGIHMGQLTEFCGVPGIGKTQLGMQLAADVQIPQAFNGLEGHCIYIDTEGSFSVDRMRQMAESLVKHLHKLAVNSDIKKAAIANFTVEAVLDRIHYFRVTDLQEQLAVIRGLAGFLHQHPEYKVKLVVIDSVAFHLRLYNQDFGDRARILQQLSQDLMKIACDNDLAMVVMNQVTTKFTQHDTKLVPALGESWAHAATNRVILFWKEQERWASLYKSPSLPNRSAEYVVTRDGIRGKKPSQKRPRPV